MFVVDIAIALPRSRGHDAAAPVSSSSMSVAADDDFLDARRLTYSFRSTRSTFNSVSSTKHVGNPSRSLSSALSTLSDASLTTSSARRRSRCR